MLQESGQNIKTTRIMKLFKERKHFHTSEVRIYKRKQESKKKRKKTGSRPRNRSRKKRFLKFFSWSLSFSMREHVFLTVIVYSFFSWSLVLFFKSPPLHHSLFRCVALFPSLLDSLIDSLKACHVIGILQYTAI